MKTLYILDGSAFVYRSFFALPQLSTKSGFPTGAVYGFMRAILSILKAERPKYFVVVFDHPAPTIKKEIYSDYKSKRPPMPDPLRLQIPVIKELLKLMGIPLLEVEGYEADDIIGYITQKAVELSFYVKIYSPDKDILQLVSEKVSVINPISGEFFDRQAVLKKFGVSPELIPDLLALAGDKVDNIEGIKGIGKKTAIKVLEKYQSVTNILRNFEDFQAFFPYADREKLELSYALVKLHPVPEMNLKEEDIRLKKPDMESLKRRLLELEMKSLIKDVESLSKSLSQRQLF
ncbi:5'-3' exonuclease H3TH domain-containing protein [Hydrogenobacter thermophilus]|uniref:5'-3' exonuclease n=1 Tax=Hydrogenobacter thermophilus TaxID=940 RepID=UPI0030FC3A11